MSDPFRSLAVCEKPREKFLRQPTDLYVVTAQPGQVFDKHSGDIPGFNSGYHFLKSGPLHGGSGNAIVS